MKNGSGASRKPRAEDAGFAGTLRRALSRAPLEAPLYASLGREAFDRAPRRPLAHALLRSARWLDPRQPGLEDAIARAAAALTPALELEPNIYSRTRAVADEIARLRGAAPCSVIDVGGGRGDLARFLDPADDYFLAEPGINGISGEKLPVADKSFDYSVSSHVLEHVPTAQRHAFLDSMARVARRAVVVLVPVEIGGPERVAQRLKFFIEITEAKWAKEHLACSHPTPEFFRAYASDRGYALESRPVGNSRAGKAIVLMKHYAALCGRKEEQPRINRFFNESYGEPNPPDSDQYLFTFAMGRQA